MNSFYKKTTLLILFHFYALAIFSQLTTTLPKNPEFSSDFALTTILSGKNEVPANATTGGGIATVTFTDSFRMARIQITVNGLSSPITGAHIHNGRAGTNGPIVFNFNTNIINSKINSSFAVTPTQVRAMLSGDYYVNVHTTANPSGEVRGQLYVDAPESYMVVADGTKEVPANATPGQALASINYNPANNVLEMKMLATNMTGTITGIHFHKGAVGVNGSVVQNLITYLNGTTIDAKFKAGTYIQDMRNGELYLNLHTAANAGGEIRGQIIPVNGLHFDGWMNGVQENPALNVPGLGLFVGHVKNSLDSVVVRGLTSDLSGNITNSHLHTAALGTNGGVAINLGPTVVGKAIGNDTPLPMTKTQMMNLLRGSLYMNVHTAANAGGEIRGQIYRLAREAYSFDMCTEQEVPAVTNAIRAIGGGYFSYGRNLDEATINLQTNGLTANITGAHIHNAAKGSNGSVVLNFGSQVSNGFASFTIDTTFTPNLYAIIKAGNGYMNVHTSTNAGGEIRGQIEKYSVCSTIVSTNDAEKLDALSIYPNPVQNILTIEGINDNKEYKILDISGKIRLKGRGNSIDVSSIKSGIYFIKYNEYSATKFIKI